MFISNVTLLLCYSWSCETDNVILNNEKIAQVEHEDYSHSNNSSKENNVGETMWRVLFFQVQHCNPMTGRGFRYKSLTTDETNKLDDTTNSILQYTTSPVHYPLVCKVC